MALAVIEHLGPTVPQQELIRGIIRIGNPFNSFMELWDIVFTPDGQPAQTSVNKMLASGVMKTYTNVWVNLDNYRRQYNQLLFTPQQLEVVNEMCTNRLTMMDDCEIAKKCLENVMNGIADYTE